MRTQDCHDRSSPAAASNLNVSNSGPRGLRLSCRIVSRAAFIWLGSFALSVWGACHLAQASELQKPAANKPDGNKPNGSKPAAGKPDGSKPADTKPPLHWRDSLACGQTSCYVFLKLCGAPHSLDDVRAAVPVTAEKGTNLADMAHGCKQLGLDVDLVRSAPSEFDRAPLPVIARLSYPVSTLNKEMAATEPVGHFVVVVGMDDRTVAMIDASTPVGITPLVRLNRGAFLRQWTGELLVKHVDRSIKWSTAIGPLLCGLTSVTLVAIWYFAPRRRTSGSFGIPAVPQ